MKKNLTKKSRVKNGQIQKLRKLAEKLNLKQKKNTQKGNGIMVIIANGSAPR